LCYATAQVALSLSTAKERLITLRGSKSSEKTINHANPHAMHDELQSPQIAQANEIKRRLATPDNL